MQGGRVGGYNAKERLVAWVGFGDGSQEIKGTKTYAPYSVLKARKRVEGGMLVRTRTGGKMRLGWGQGVREEAGY